MTMICAHASLRSLVIWQAALLDLPGLEDDVAPPPGPRRGQLPLASDADTQSFFGNAFAQGGQEGSSLR
jgi:hypothetical protein